MAMTSDTVCCGSIGLCVSNRIPPSLTFKVLPAPCATISSFSSIQKYDRRFSELILECFRLSFLCTSFTQAKSLSRNQCRKIRRMLKRLVLFLCRNDTFVQSNSFRNFHKRFLERCQWIAWLALGLRQTHIMKKFIAYLDVLLAVIIFQLR